jgi:hypothetical protein
MSIISENFTTLFDGSYRVDITSELPRDFVTNVLAHLAAHTTTPVKIMYFRDCAQITDQQSELLRRFLTANRTLEVLSFDRFTYSRRTLQGVATALQFNTTLRELVIHRTPRVDYEGYIERGLVAALKINARRPARSLWAIFGDLEREGRLYNDLPLLLEEARK